MDNHLACNFLVEDRGAESGVAGFLQQSGYKWGIGAHHVTDSQDGGQDFREGADFVNQIFPIV